MTNKISGIRVVMLVALVCPVFADSHTPVPVQALPGIVDAPKPTAHMGSSSEASSAAVMPAPSGSHDMSEVESALYEQVRLLNQVPEEQMNDQSEPVLSILRKIYDKDGTLFPNLKKLLGRAEVRGPLKPGTKALVATLLSDRWDTFNLSGNLWLAALQTPNSGLRGRAQLRLVSFVQPAHIPVLINLLKVPGPNIAAYEVLQEATGQTLDPSVNAWKTWWAQMHGKVDLIGHLLDTTDIFIHSNPVKPFASTLFWYAPNDIKNTSTPYEKRGSDEQMKLSQWNQAAVLTAKQYIDQWNTVKPYLDRVTHQPDERVTAFLEKLVFDPGLGDYASAVLAWRGSKSSLKAIQDAYAQIPSAGRALGRGSLGDATVFPDLLKVIDATPQPSSIPMMDQNVHGALDALRVTGQLSSEQVLEFLARQNFGLMSAVTRSEKKKATKAAHRWYERNVGGLIFDSVHGTFATPQPQ